MNSAEQLADRIRDVLRTVGNETVGLTVRELHLSLRAKGITVEQGRIYKVVRVCLKIRDERSSDLNA